MSDRLAGWSPAGRRRLAMLAFIQQNPGCGLRELARALNIPYSRAHQLMAQLEALGLVEVSSDGRNLHYLTGLDVKHAKQRTTLARADCCQLYDWLCRSAPTGILQERALDYARQEWNWSRSKTHRLLERMRDAGLIAWNNLNLIQVRAPLSLPDDSLAEDAAQTAAEQRVLLRLATKVTQPAPTGSSEKRS